MTSQLERSFKTGDGVFAVDQEQRIIFWNSGAEAILGFVAAEVMGQPCHAVIQGVEERGEACVPDCPVIGCVHRGQPTPGQNLRARRKDGTFRWLSMTHLSPGPSNGYSAALVHVFRDITPEVEAKRLLGAMAAQMADWSFRQEEATDRPVSNDLLTEREAQVLALLAQGEGTESIASKLTISNTTTRNYIQSILAKLGVHTRLEAVAYALRHGLIDEVRQR